MTHPLVPLLILFIILLVAAFIGYIVYTIANDIADKTNKNLEKRHVTFTKDGMKVGLKQVKEEDYVAQTQRYEVSCKFPFQRTVSALESPRAASGSCLQ